MARDRRYGCGTCGSPIEPEYVWAMESGGRDHSKVLITFHCTCAAHYSFRYGTYTAAPEPIAYLLDSQGGVVHHTVDGGWWWENPVQMRTVAPWEEPLPSFRERLARIHTVDDFLAACDEGGDWDDFAWA